ncbi:thiolase domain-containing protein, partial [Candidatus Woesearchaeota archaeon]|nr:thiolase domain-containing protein [Candidatus Woesearchaeota archaeon]
MFIKGVGMTKLGTKYRLTYELAYEAAYEALEDADMSISDIDAVVSSCMDIPSNGDRQRHSASVLASLFKTKIPIIRIPAGCAGGGHALWTALKMKYNNMLVIGTEKLLANTTKTITDEILMGGERVYEQTEGLTFPAQNALVAQQYMLKYGATTDDFALVSLKNHENAYSNPKARFYGKKISLEKIKESPIIASPLRLFDCCPNVNGAAACIVTKDKTDIKVKGSASYTDYLSPLMRKDMSSWDATKMAAEEAYKQASIEASEIDFAEIHDAFTPIELLSYEDLGFCSKGEGKNLIRDGTTKLDGKLPVNPCGGLKAKGHPISATGLAQIYEIVKQMRHEAKD